MAGDNERFTVLSQRWRKVADFISNPDVSLDESLNRIMDAIYETVRVSRNELKKWNFLERVTQAFATGDAAGLAELIHETKGNQLARIMSDAAKMSEPSKIAIQRVLCQTIKRLFSDIEARARPYPERYMHIKERLSSAWENVPAMAEELAVLLVDKPSGRWPKSKTPKCELSDSLLG